MNATQEKEPGNWMRKCLARNPPPKSDDEPPPVMVSECYGYQEPPPKSDDEPPPKI